MDNSANSLLFDCPICFRHYADAEPTTLPCGHSICMEDAKSIAACPLCNKFVPKRPAINYILRDLAVHERNKDLKAKEEAESAMSMNFYNMSIDPSLPVYVPRIQEDSKSKSMERPMKESSYSSIVKGGSPPAQQKPKTADHVFSKVAKRSDPERVNAVPTSSSSSTVARKEIEESSISDGLNILSLKAFPTASVYTAFSESYEAPMPTTAQSGWRDALLRVSYESRRPLVVVDVAKTQIIVLMVVSVCVSPGEYVDDVCRSTVTERLSKTHPSLAGDVPLLALSYCHSADIEQVDSIVSGMSTPLTLAVQDVDTLDAVEFELLLTYLKQQEEMLSDQYKRHFQTLNFHLSHPSFVMPLPKLKGNVKIGVCALPTCGVRGCIVRCHKCKGPMYCSREHQKEHWKAHKPNCVNASGC